LRDGYGIQLRQAFGRGHSLVDENSIDAFQIRQHDQLFQCSGIAHVAGLAKVGLPPLRCGDTKQGDVEQVGFAGIHHAGLRPGQGRRDQAFLDGVGVDLVVDLGQRALEVPFKRL